MTTITLKYDARSSLMKHLVDAMLIAGAQVVEMPKKTIVTKNETLEGYQKMFGKRKNNKYTDNEIFVYNSQRNLSKILEKYAD
jgi:hypothetical protein